jgi:hypothetical protein
MSEAVRLPDRGFVATARATGVDMIMSKECVCGRRVVYFLEHMDEPMTAECSRCGSVLDLRYPSALHPMLEGAA